MKKLFFTFACLFVLFSFTSDSNRIPWQSQRQLNWKDFKGEPDYSDDFRAAVTASSIQIRIRCNANNRLSYDVSADFIKDKSWVKEIARTNYHLGHEQLHFDITEIYVRKIREALSHIEPICDNQTLAHELAQEIMEQCSDAQQRYDNATKYSLDPEEQAIWKGHVDRKLHELRKFEAR